MNLKITNKTDLQVCKAISFLTMCVKFCLHVGKLSFCKCQELTTGLDPEFGINMMEIKVEEINVPLN